MFNIHLALSIQKKTSFYITKQCGDKISSALARYSGQNGLHDPQEVLLCASGCADGFNCLQKKRTPKYKYSVGFRCIKAVR